MNETKLCLPPLDQVDTPVFKVPAGTCDCHAHVFGSQKKYPLIVDRSYTPPEASVKAYQNMHRKLGITRAVIVQPSIYGNDNKATFEAIRKYGDENARGVAVVADNVSENTLEMLHLRGIRGVRFNLLFKGGAQLKDLEYIASKVAVFKWHVQLLIDVSELPSIDNRLRRLPTEVVFDHMGHMPAHRTVNNSGFQALINLIKEGRAWAKLSGNYRISTARPSYKDVTALARALISASNRRVIWGSDWPHPGLYDNMPNDGALLNALNDYAPSDTLKQAILVDNPAQLYDFDPPLREEDRDK